MKPNTPIAILVYGTLQATQIQEKTDLPVFNVTKAGWKEALEKKFFPQNILECKFYAIGHAASFGRKTLCSSCIIGISSFQTLLKEKELVFEKKTEEEKKDIPAAIKVGDVLISPKYHPAVKETRVWLSTQHLGLVDKLFKEGYEIEILDEGNNVIRTIGKS